ncbi:MAG: hypothetical protein ACTSQW_06055 [Promethearchaeota archaeon]
MDKKRIILLIFLIGLTFFSFNIKKIAASDDDDDGIDDDFEELNKRDISIEIEANQTQIESSLRTGEKKDEIQLKLTYESEGLGIEISYESELSSESSNEFEIEFSITFRKLIEFVDMNSNNKFDPLIDVIIQEKDLNTFLPIEYIPVAISNDTDLHYFIVKTTDGNFSAHIYFSEEFLIINNTIVTPIQTKIDIEINSFPYINESSQIALYTSLESEIDYEDADHTEDEELGYAINEGGLITNLNDFEGIFTWNNNASIDGSSKKINVSSLNTDDYDGDDQKIYMTYPRGTIIYHDPKVGISGIYQIINGFDDPLFMIVLIAIITSLSLSVGYSIYHYRESIFSKFDVKSSEKSLSTGDILNDKLNSKKLTPIFDNERLKAELKNLSLKNPKSLKNTKITALSEDFFKILALFDWEDDQLYEFSKEMLALSPEERQGIYDEMVKKSEQQEKNRLDVSKRLYT